MPPEDYCPRFQVLLDVFTKRAAIKCSLFRKQSRNFLVLSYMLVLITSQGITLLKCRLYVKLWGNGCLMAAPLPWTPNPGGCMES